MIKLARRTFAALLPGAAVASAWGQTNASAQIAPTPRPAPLAPDLVKDWIIKAHQRKIDPMKELLKREPTLLQSSWDWGAGDFESALEAAAHTGSRDMALFLMDQGGRVCLFAATMLGQTPLLKMAIETIPAALQVPGAHGIPLLTHAVAGQQPALPSLEYLLAKGPDVNGRSNGGGTALMMAVQTNQRETVQLLLSKGADPKVKTPDGATALSISLKTGNATIASDLKAAGAID